LLGLPVNGHADSFGPRLRLKSSLPTIPRDLARFASSTSLPLASASATKARNEFATRLDRGIAPLLPAPAEPEAGVQRYRIVFGVDCRCARELRAVARHANHFIEIAARQVIETGEWNGPIEIAAKRGT
jgi:hypothetical protein